jgi:type IV secretory pathway VirJ component
MSVFSEEGQPSQTQETELTTQTTEPTESFVAKLVEAKGDNWKDPEVLAKGKLEADRYIKELEDQLNQMREDLKKEDYAEKILQEIRNKAADTSTANRTLPNNNTAGAAEEGTPKPSLSEEDLKSLVEKTLTEREQLSTVTQNLRVVDEELQKQYGTEAQKTVAKKAQELGMSMDRMKEIASESPTAFFALIGEGKKNFNPMVNSSVRTEGVNLQSSTERDWSFYQKLRRENRDLYYTPKIQQQLMQDKSRLGDKFGA